MTEEQLNENLIKLELQGICQDCIYLDKIVPIIRKMLSEEYKTGLEQSRFDKNMLERENRELKKKLGEQQYYKFYKYDNNPDGSDYCYCERPCDDNMSLLCFLENGEILGFMSETLVSAYDNIKEITMSDFMFEFVKPLIKENYIMRTQQQEFIEWLEDYIDALKQQKETIEGLDIGEEHILMILEEVLEKYKEIIGVNDEKI